MWAPSCSWLSSFLWLCSDLWVHVGGSAGLDWVCLPPWGSAGYANLGWRGLGLHSVPLYCLPSSCNVALEETHGNCREQERRQLHELFSYCFKTLLLPHLLHATAQSRSHGWPIVNREERKTRGKGCGYMEGVEISSLNIINLPQMLLKSVYSIKMPTKPQRTAI